MTQAAKVKRAKKRRDKEVRKAACDEVRRRQKMARAETFPIRKVTGKALDRMGELLGVKRDCRPGWKYRKVLAAVIRMKSEGKLLEVY